MYYISFIVLKKIRDASISSSDVVLLSSGINLNTNMVNILSIKEIGFIDKEESSLNNQMLVVYLCGFL